MKKTSLLAFLFLISACTSQTNNTQNQTETPSTNNTPAAQVNSDLYPKEMVMNFSAETVCLLVAQSKKANLEQMASQMEAIAKKYNIDPKDPAQKEKLQRSAEAYKKDAQFKIDLNNKMKSLCGLGQ